MLYADTHIFGSHDGYGTRAKSAGVTPQEERDLTEFGYSDTYTHSHLTSLATIPSAYGRRLQSGRFAVTRVFAGPMDIAGRTTLEFRSLILSATDYLAVRKSLPALLKETKFWQGPHFRQDSGGRFTQPSGNRQDLGLEEWKLFDGWYKLQALGKAWLVVDESLSDSVLALAAAIHEEDALSFAWGVRLLNPVHWTQVLSLCAEGSTQVSGGRVYGVNKTGWCEPRLESYYRQQPNRIPSIQQILTGTIVGAPIEPSKPHGEGVGNTGHTQAPSTRRLWRWLCAAAVLVLVVGLCVIAFAMQGRVGGAAVRPHVEYRENEAKMFVTWTSGTLEQFDEKSNWTAVESKTGTAAELDAEPGRRYRFRVKPLWLMPFRGTFETVDQEIPVRLRLQEHDRILYIQCTNAPIAWSEQRRLCTIPCETTADLSPLLCDPKQWSCDNTATDKWIFQRCDLPKELAIPVGVRVKRSEKKEDSWETASPGPKATIYASGGSSPCVWRCLAHDEQCPPGESIFLLPQEDKVPPETSYDLSREAIKETCVEEKDFSQKESQVTFDFPVPGATFEYQEKSSPPSADWTPCERIESKTFSFRGTAGKTYLVRRKLDSGSTICHLEYPIKETPPPIAAAPPPKLPDCKFEANEGHILVTWDPKALGTGKKVLLWRKNVKGPGDEKPLPFDVQDGTYKDIEVVAGDRYQYCLAYEDTPPSTWKGPSAVLAIKYPKDVEELKGRVESTFKEIAALLEELVKLRKEVDQPKSPTAPPKQEAKRQAEASFQAKLAEARESLAKWDTKFTELEREHETAKEQASPNAPRPIEDKLLKDIDSYLHGPKGSSWNRLLQLITDYLCLEQAQAWNRQPPTDYQDSDSKSPKSPTQRGFKCKCEQADSNRNSKSPSPKVTLYKDTQEVVEEEIKIVCKTLPTGSTESSLNELFVSVLDRIKKMPKATR